MDHGSNNNQQFYYQYPPGVQLYYQPHAQYMRPENVVFQRPTYPQNLPFYPRQMSPIMNPPPHFQPHFYGNNPSNQPFNRTTPPPPTGPPPHHHGHGRKSPSAFGWPVVQNPSSPGEVPYQSPPLNTSGSFPSHPSGLPLRSDTIPVPPREPSPGSFPGSYPGSYSGFKQNPGFMNAAKQHGIQIDVPNKHDPLPESHQNQPHQTQPLQSEPFYHDSKQSSVHLNIDSKHEWPALTQSRDSKQTALKHPNVQSLENESKQTDLKHQVISSSKDEYKHTSDKQNLESYSQKKEVKPSKTEELPQSKGFSAQSQNNSAQRKQHQSHAYQSKKHKKVSKTMTEEEKMIEKKRQENCFWIPEDSEESSSDNDEESMYHNPNKPAKEITQVKKNQFSFSSESNIEEHEFLFSCDEMYNSENSSEKDEDVESVKDGDLEKKCEQSVNKNMENVNNNEQSFGTQSEIPVKVQELDKKSITKTECNRVQSAYENHRHFEPNCTKSVINAPVLDPCVKTYKMTISKCFADVKESEKAINTMLDKGLSTDSDVEMISLALVKEAIAKGVLKFYKTQGGISQKKSDVAVESKSMQIEQKTEIVTPPTRVECDIKNEDKDDTQCKKLYTWNSQIVTYGSESSSDTDTNNQVDLEKVKNKKAKKHESNYKDTPISIDSTIKENEKKEKEIIVKASEKTNEDFEKFYFKQKASQHGICIESPHDSKEAKTTPRDKSKLITDAKKQIPVVKRCNSDIDGTAHYVQKLPVTLRSHSEGSDSDSSYRSRKLSGVERFHQCHSEDYDSDPYSVDSSQGDAIEAFRIKASMCGIKIQDPKDISIDSEVELNFPDIDMKGGIIDSCRKATSTPDYLQANLNPQSPEFRPGARIRRDSADIKSGSGNASANTSGSEWDQGSQNMRADAPEFTPFRKQKSMNVTAPAFEPRNHNNNWAPQKVKEKPLICYLPTPFEPKKKPCVGVQVSPHMSNSSTGTKRRHFRDTGTFTTSCDSREVCVNTEESHNSSFNQTLIAQSPKSASKGCNTVAPKQRSVGVDARPGLMNDIQQEQSGLHTGYKNDDNKNLTEKVKQLQVELMSYKHKEIMVKLTSEVTGLEQHFSALKLLCTQRDEKESLERLLLNKKEHLTKLMAHVKHVTETTVSQIKSGWVLNELPDFTTLFEDPPDLSQTTQNSSTSVIPSTSNSAEYVDKPTDAPLFINIQNQNAYDTAEHLDKTTDVSLSMNNRNLNTSNNAVPWGHNEDIIASSQAIVSKGCEMLSGVDKQQTQTMQKIEVNNNFMASEESLVKKKVDCQKENKSNLDETEAGKEKKQKSIMDLDDSEEDDSSDHTPENEQHDITNQENLPSSIIEATKEKPSLDLKAFKELSDNMKKLILEKMTDEYRGLQESNNSSVNGNEVGTDSMSVCKKKFKQDTLNSEDESYNEPMQEPSVLQNVIEDDIESTSVYKKKPKMDTIESEEESFSESKQDSSSSAKVKEVNKESMCIHKRNLKLDTIDSEEESYSESVQSYETANGSVVDLSDINDDQNTINTNQADKQTESKKVKQLKNSNGATYESKVEGVLIESAIQEPLLKKNQDRNSDVPKLLDKKLNHKEEESGYYENSPTNEIREPTMNNIKSVVESGNTEDLLSPSAPISNSQERALDMDVEKENTDKAQTDKMKSDTIVINESQAFDGDESSAQSITQLSLKSGASVPTAESKESSPSTPSALPETEKTAAEPKGPDLNSKLITSLASEIVPPVEQPAPGLSTDVSKYNISTIPPGVQTLQGLSQPNVNNNAVTPISGQSQLRLPVPNNNAASVVPSAGQAMQGVADAAVDPVMLGMLGTVDPLLCQAVMGQLIEAYPEMAANQALLMTVTLQQTQLLQQLISQGQGAHSEAPLNINSGLNSLTMGEIPNQFNMGNQPTPSNMANIPALQNMASLPNQFNITNIPIQPNMGNISNSANIGKMPDPVNIGNIHNPTNIGMIKSETQKRTHDANLLDNAFGFSSKKTHLPKAVDDCPQLPSHLSVSKDTKIQNENGNFCSSGVFAGQAKTDQIKYTGVETIKPDLAKRPPGYHTNSTNMNIPTMSEPSERPKLKISAMSQKLATNNSFNNNVISTLEKSLSSKGNVTRQENIVDKLPNVPYGKDNSESQRQPISKPTVPNSRDQSEPLRQPISKPTEPKSRDQSELLRQPISKPTEPTSRDQSQPLRQPISKPSEPYSKNQPEQLRQPISKPTEPNSRDQSEPLRQPYNKPMASYSRGLSEPHRPLSVTSNSSLASDRKGLQGVAVPVQQKPVQLASLAKKHSPGMKHQMQRIPEPIPSCSSENWDEEIDEFPETFDLSMISKQTTKPKQKPQIPGLETVLTTAQSPVESIGSNRKSAGELDDIELPVPKKSIAKTSGKSDVKKVSDISQSKMMKDMTKPSEKRGVTVKKLSEISQSKVNKETLNQTEKISGMGQSPDISMEKMEQENIKKQKEEKNDDQDKPVEEEEQWCEVQSKRKRHTSKEQAVEVRKPPVKPPTLTASQRQTRNTNFERLVNRISLDFPHAERQAIIDAIATIRNIRGSLSGMSMESIVEKAHIYIKNKPQKQVQTRPSPKIQTRQSPTQECPSGGRQDFSSNLPPRLQQQTMAKMGRTAPSPHGHTASQALTQMAAQQFIKNQPIADDEEICVICHDALDCEPVKTLDCSHVFHTMCISQWVERERTCPTCRQHALFPEEFPALGK